MDKTSLAYKIKQAAGIITIRAFEQLLHAFTPDADAAYFESARFPFTKFLEAHAEKIKLEYLHVAATTSIPPFQQLSSEQRVLTSDEKWKTYFLSVYGYDFVDHHERCPVTSSCLLEIPLLTTAMFSILEPGKVIPLHRGPYKGVLRCHLPLLVPDEKKCFITVNGITRHWQEGKCLIFDDSFPHTASNLSKGVRVVLFIDFLRPLPFPLNHLNRWLFRLIARSEFIGEIVERSALFDGGNVKKRKIKVTAQATGSRVK